MKNVLVVKTFVVAITIIIFSNIVFPADFGKNIFLNDRLTPHLFTGDFNGDLKKDTIQLLQIASNPSVVKRCKVINPWYDTPICKGGEPLALGIISSTSDPKNPALCIVHDSGFFATPIWGAKNMPVEVVRKGSSAYKKWKRDVPDLMTDAVVLGTEAGIDILLYWNGKEYQLFQPSEDP